MNTQPWKPASFPYLQIAQRNAVSYSDVLIAAHAHVYGQKLPGHAEAVSRLQAHPAHDAILDEMLEAFRDWERVQVEGFGG